MKSLVVLLVRWLVSLRYRVKVVGLEDVAAKGREGILFLPNHPALMDPVLLFLNLYPAFRPRALADRDRTAGGFVGLLVRLFRIIPMMDTGVYGAASLEDVHRALDACAEALRQKDNLILYPSGHLQSHTLIHVGGNSAVEAVLARVPEARVVLVRTQGMWGSSFSWATGHRPVLGPPARHGILKALQSLVFFMPRRRVTLELVNCPEFPKTADRATQNRFLEAFYNQEPRPALYVPYTPWERGGVRELPDPERRKDRRGLDEVQPLTRRRVQNEITRLTGLEVPGDAATLSRDLGMDSLSRLELAVWLEAEFKVPQPNPEALETVGDVLLAASGFSPDTGEVLRPVDPCWFQSRTQPVEVAEGATVLESMLNQAARDPGRVLMADQTSGIKTFRDLVTGVCVLAPVLRRLKGTHVGIMLPASVGATTVYFATLAAGKVPVMVNWTVGSRSMRHGLDLLGVRHVLTAGALVQRLLAQGVDLSGAEGRLLPLEALRQEIGLGAKLRGVIQARFFSKTLLRRPVPETAAVLFTSGSESLPKAVPISHTNLLVNLRDSLQEVAFLPDECLLAILPPFHSFGLLANILLSSLSGMKAIYHPNPTEGPVLARLIEAYRVSLMVGTPTFLQGIVRSAADAQLRSMRVVVTGAERCPDSLFSALERRWPRIEVLEGYGITECSPIVSANRPGRTQRGTVGQPWPSVETLIVDPDTNTPVPEGSQGMLLVRGPSIFSGYLHYEGPSPFVEVAGKTWYRTGDLVRWNETGALVFLGRLKRFAKLGGEMVSLPAVEEVLSARFGRPEDEEVILAVEATAAEVNPDLVLFTVRDILREEANAAIREAGLSPIHFVKAVVRLEKIPVLGTGKTDYRALKSTLS